MILNRISRVLRKPRRSPISDFAVATAIRQHRFVNQAQDAPSSWEAYISGEPSSGRNDRIWSETGRRLRGGS